MAKKHKIKLLKPPPHEYVPTPQCCVPVQAPSYNSDWRAQRYKERGTDPKLCQRNSTVIIDGKPYCRLHAGQVALDILLMQELEEEDAKEKSKSEATTEEKATIGRSAKES